MVNTDPRLIFLRARLSELEVAATEAIHLGEILKKRDDDQLSTVLTWRWGLLSELVADGRPLGGHGSMFCEGAPTPEDVLADVDSKRRIIELHEVELAREMAKPRPRDASAFGAWLMKKDVITELLRPFQKDPAFQKEWLT